MPWRQADLRGSKVFVKCDAEGRPVATGGRVEVRYREGVSKAYQAGEKNFTLVGDALLPDSRFGEALPADPSAPATTRSSKVSPKKAAAAAGPPPTKAAEGTVLAYADGACTGNPGPAGLGVVMIDGEGRLELSEYLGHGTNNIAELTAIQRAAEKLAGDPRRLELYTDSSYAIGVLSKGWKAKANIELIADVKKALAKLASYKLHYVPGHAGVALNERADELARQAVKGRATTPWLASRVIAVNRTISTPG